MQNNIVGLMTANFAATTKTNFKVQFSTEGFYKGNIKRKQKNIKFFVNFH